MRTKRSRRISPGDVDAADAGAGGPHYNATILRGNEHALLHEAMAKRPWWRPTPDGEPFSLWWAGNGQGFDWSNGLSATLAPAQPGGRGQRPLQLVNTFRAKAEVCTKPRLALNLRRYAREAKIDATSLAPLTFVVTAGIGDDGELARFQTASAALASERGERLWIVKPRNQNRGNGIEVCSSPKAVEAHLKRKKVRNSGLACA